MLVDLKAAAHSGTNNTDPGVLCLDAADFRHRLAFLRAQATAIRRWTIALAGHPGADHIDQALSTVDLLTTLYFHVLRVNPTLPAWVERDRFLVSSGDITTALYATLGARGFIRAEELRTFLADGSRLTGRPSAAVPGVELSIGSPGDALAVGIGLSLAARRFQTEWRTFVMLAEEDCADGQTWDAALAAVRLRVDTLIAVVNDSAPAPADHPRERGRVERLVAKWESFGWSVQEVDGHDIGALSGAFEHFARLSEQPGVIIARTTLGKGVGFIEQDPARQHLILMAADVERALKELA